MNILTPNRILQDGDEMLAGGEWGPIPATEFGLQVEFSKYAKYKIRRPSEPESTAQNGAGETPVPPRTTPEVAKDAATAPTKVEGMPPAPPLPKPKPLSETYGKAKPKVLPTVVSQKAHDRITSGQVASHKPVTIPAQPEPVVHGISTKDAIKARNEAVVAAAVAEAEAAKPTFITPSHVISRHGKVYETSIPFSDLSAKPEWIGRNGTFKAKAIRITSRPNGLIQIRPEGARGLAKNALIEFPAAEIPKVIDWLLRHQVPVTTGEAKTATPL
jgi:hypothetical protein